MAFFRPAPRRRCPVLTPGPNCTKLGFLCFCRPFHLNRALETGRHHYQQIGTVLAVFWRFFGWLKDDAVLHSPLARIAPNSYFWAFAGHFNGIGCWKLKNTTISRLPQFCSLEQLLAFFRLAPRRRCPALTSGPNCTKLGFLCFCRPFHLNRALETGRHHYQQIGTVLAVFWRFFGWLKDDAVLHSPLARIAPNSVSWAFAGHFYGIER